MNIPFTMDEFFEVFRTYNEAVWPAQVFLNLVAIVVVFMAFRPGKGSSGLTSYGLAFLWLWTGAAYHLIFFTAINPAAYIFGTVCIFQASLFLWVGGIRKRITFKMNSNLAGWVGALFVFYGLIGYPLLGYSLGHIYPQSPTFGAPCPTTIFTFGMLLWTGGSLPRYFLIIPAAWSLVGFTAAFRFGVYEDYGLLVAGMTASAILALRRKAAEGASTVSTT